MSTSKHTGAMLSYMKVMHYGLMFPKACYGDAALIWNALCGKWIYRSGEKKPGVGADHNLKLDLIGSSKSPWVWIFRTYVQYVWGTEAAAAKATHRNMRTWGRCAGRLQKLRRMNNHCDNQIRKVSFHILIIRATGVAPDYIALGPSRIEVCTKWDTFLIIPPVAK